MTTLADLTLQVRRGLKDFPKLRTDQGNADGVTTVFDLGKDLGVITSSDVVSVAAAVKVRNVDYTIDYDGNQIVFTVPPGLGAQVRVQYKEAVWRDEPIYDAVNAGRRALFMRHYQRGFATITVRNLVRDYDLATVDVNEPAMRAVFARDSGHMAYAILNARYQPNGTSDQLWVPFKRFEEVGKSQIHLYDLLPASYTLRLEVIYAFVPLVAPADVSDIPDVLQDLVILWAIGMLALKKEPERNRLDTANVLQSAFANQPGLMAQTAEDFQAKWKLLREAIPSRFMLAQGR